MNIVDNTKPNKTVKIEALPAGRFFKFTNDGVPGQLYRKLDPGAMTADMQKLIAVDRLIEVVETGKITFATLGYLVFEVDVTVTINSIVS